MGHAWSSYHFAPNGAWQLRKTEHMLQQCVVEKKGERSGTPGDSK